MGRTKCRASDEGNEEEEEEEEDEEDDMTQGRSNEEYQ